MKLLCVGLNWKTPIRLRERLAIDGASLPAALTQWRERRPGAELTVLSTCNRTELYAAPPPAGAQVDIDDVAEFLASSTGLNLVEFYDHLYFHEDAGTALHLFKVASGLDSLVLGEGQILGQVRQAYQAAVEAGSAGPLMHALFQKAIAVAKRVQTETGLARGRLSIASAAVDYVRGVFEDFDDKTVLIIGAGKMAELTLTHLKECTPRRIIVLNRSLPRAEDLSRRFGGEARPFETLLTTLTEADIVVSSTGADEPIVRAAEFHGVMKARQHRLMAILDLAVPRDFDMGVSSIDNVLLWNVDDLEKVRDRTLRSRRGELDKALKIVDAETQDFQTEMALKQSGPVIGRLEREYQNILDAELERLMRQLNGIPSDQAEKIRLFAHRLKNKFLHQPKTALREQAHAGAPSSLLDAFRKLFGLHTD